MPVCLVRDFGRLNRKRRKIWCRQCAAKRRYFRCFPLIAQVLCTSVAAAGLVRAECARPVLVRMLSYTYKRGRWDCLFLKTGLAL
jgi:hypothetical protein